jgi:hypothetical protein
MSIRSTTVEPHWNYFLTIEQDVQRLARFVEFDERNNKCCSVEIAHLLLAASSEVDVVCKQICLQLNPKTTAGNIARYKTAIVKAYPTIAQFTATLPRY